MPTSTAVHCFFLGSLGLVMCVCSSVCVHCPRCHCLMVTLKMPHCWLCSRCQLLTAPFAQYFPLHFPSCPPPLCFLSPPSSFSIFLQFSPSSATAQKSMQYKMHASGIGLFSGLNCTFCLLASWSVRFYGCVCVVCVHVSTLAEILR